MPCKLVFILSLFLLVSMCPKAYPSGGFVNSLGMSFELIPAGSFDMGRDGGPNNQAPKHRTSITVPFYLATCELTQEIYLGLVKNNPSHFVNLKAPVDNLSWSDAFEFLVMLNELEGTTGYRFPSEAQWEYAARGATSSESFVPEGESLEDYAWFLDNSENSTRRACDKKANPFGLKDIYGNVWEWVADWYNPGYYQRAQQNDPRGPRSGLEKVIRGGGFFNKAETLNSVNRFAMNPTLRYNSVGLRVLFVGDPSTLAGGKENSALGAAAPSGAGAQAPAVSPTQTPSNTPTTAPLDPGAQAPLASTTQAPSSSPTGTDFNDKNNSEGGEAPPADYQK